MTPEEEIRQIDTDITKLKIQFDLYFLGSVPRPPMNERDALDKQLKKLQFNLKSPGERFLYNSVVNKFNAFSELWLKKVNTKEEGAHLHPLARRHAMRAGGAAGATGGSAGAGARQGSTKRRAGKTGANAPTQDSWRIPTAGKDEAALKSFYENFIAAKERVGDSKRPSFEAFSREIARHAATLKGQGDCDQVDFRIYCDDKKISIKAKPLK